MSKVLYIDATVRDESRTKIIADYLLKKLDGDVKYLPLSCIKMPELNGPMLEFRNKCCQNRDFSSPMYDLAKDFISADNIILAAPFWDASFPATVKEYFETICVNHLLFEYDEKGQPHGKAKAECLYYVTTAGGFMGDGEFGYGYLRFLCKGMFGIEHTHMFKAEGLDIYGADVPAILEKAKKEIDDFFGDLNKKKA